MIDNAQIKVLGFSPRQWTILEFEIGSEAKNPSNTKRVMFWGNLRLTYFLSSQTLLIENSLHKFYNLIVRKNTIQNCNYNDFGEIELRLTLRHLKIVLNCDFKDFVFYGTLEYGININTSPKKADDVIDSYISLGTSKTTQFYRTVPRQGVSNGIVCGLSEYRFKIYNKTKESGCSIDNILRLEIVNKNPTRLKRILGLKQITFRDILIGGVLEKLGEDLLKTYDQTNRLPIDESVTREELIEFFAYSHPAIKRYDMENLSKWKYNDSRAKMKQRLSQHTNSKDFFHGDFREKIAQKIRRLTNCEVYNNNY